MPNHAHGIIVANETNESAPTLGTVVQWFKTMSTNEYIRRVKNLGWQRFDKKLWQRNYYEHIIRSQKDWERIAHCIEENPANTRNLWCGWHFSCQRQLERDMAGMPRVFGGFGICGMWLIPLLTLGLIVAGIVWVL